MTQAERIIQKFGGTAALARALGHNYPTTVQAWKSSGTIPFKHHQQIFDVASQSGIDLSASDFMVIDTAQESAA